MKGLEFLVFVSLCNLLYSDLQRNLTSQWSNLRYKNYPDPVKQPLFHHFAGGIVLKQDTIHTVVWLSQMTGICVGQPRNNSLSCTLEDLHVNHNLNTVVVNERLYILLENIHSVSGQHDAKYCNFIYEAIFLKSLFWSMGISYKYLTKQNIRLHCCCQFLPGLA